MQAGSRHLLGFTVLLSFVIGTVLIRMDLSINQNFVLASYLELLQNTKIAKKSKLQPSTQCQPPKQKRNQK